MTEPTTFQEYLLLTEELTKKQKKKVDSWSGPSWDAKKEHDRVFGEKNERVEFPLSHSEEERPKLTSMDIYRRPGDTIMKSVDEHVRQHGYHITDYHGGYAKKTPKPQAAIPPAGDDGILRHVPYDSSKEDKRVYKIGGILAQTGADKIETKHLNKAGKPITLAGAFTSDPERALAKKTQHKVVISRNKYDVAGMSTDRGWSSCANMSGTWDNAAKCLPEDIRHGTLTAYLTHHDDTDIKRPIARINLKHFEGDDGSHIWRPEKSAYGTSTEKFHDAVKDWGEKNYPESPKANIYEKNPHLYDDDGKKEILKPGGKFHPTFWTAYKRAARVFANHRDASHTSRAGRKATSEAHDRYDQELPAPRGMSPDEVTHAANHFTDSKQWYLGNIHDDSLYSSHDHDHPSLYDKHGEAMYFDHHDYGDHYPIKFDHDDYSTFLGHHVANNPAGFMEHARDKPKFAEGLHRIHEENKNMDSSNRNKNIVHPDVFHYMAKHLADPKKKEELGEEAAHVDYDEDIRNIHDQHYLRGLAHSEWLHSPSTYGSGQEELKEHAASHILKHGDVGSVSHVLHHPGWEFDADERKEASQRILHLAQTGGHEEHLTNLMHQKDSPLSNDERKAALDTLEKMRKPEKPGEQVFDKKHEAIMHHVKLESFQFPTFAEFLQS